MKTAIRTITALSLLVTAYGAEARGYGARLCQEDPNYYCYQVEAGDSWQNLFEDAQQRDLVMRINRMNTRLQAGMNIAVPQDLDHLDKLSVAPFSSQIDPQGSKLILVSLSKLAWGAYDKTGNLENWGPVSGGRGYCPDIHTGCHTPKGNFSIHSKEGAYCISTKFPVGRGGAPMPYCMFFNGGYALHGSYTVPGYNASHGCVRLFIDDAKWLNQEFTPGGKVSVRIS